MTPDQLLYWTEHLEMLQKGLPAKHHLRTIVASPEYRELTTDGKITLAILIFGHIRFGA